MEYSTSKQTIGSRVSAPQSFFTELKTHYEELSVNASVIYHGKTAFNDTILSTEFKCHWDSSMTKTLYDTTLFT